VNGALQQGWLWQSQLAPAAELDGSGTVVSRFVYATRVNVPDYMIKGGVTYRLVLDQLGSVRLVVNSANGTIVQRLDYDEFGRVTQNTNLGFQPFGFAGGLYEEQTGLVRFGARDYDAGPGRWLARDPIGFSGGDSDLFTYAGNEPVSQRDPTGLLLGGRLDFGERAGEEATQYWAGIALDPNRSWLERAGAELAGHFSSLWTPETSDWTALTLTGSYAVRVLGPFPPPKWPPYVGRIRKYLRFDRPHHGKPWQWDGSIPKWLRGFWKSSLLYLCPPGF
jgi:RHS repeat-associated protein